jgi:predicted helicase
MEHREKILNEYFTEVNKIYQQGNATEHSYRPLLKSFFEELTGLNITNEPKQISCGAPDFVVTKNNIPLGYIEAKDIDVGIDYKRNEKQFDRYIESLNNLIITDCLEYKYYKDGKFIKSVKIANLQAGKIISDKTQLDIFLEIINQFANYTGTTIDNSETLAKIMAHKTKLLAEVITTAIKAHNDEDTTLQGQFKTFKEILIHDLTIDNFADFYAQTIAYGLFAARLYKSNEEKFDRRLASELIPQFNPFLKQFFRHLSGEIDKNIVWIVDELAHIFNYVDIESIKIEAHSEYQDLYIHFYETFLQEYDRKTKKERGVYYTPQSVVKFIVKAVDDILKTEFNLTKGLADSSKVLHKIIKDDGKQKEVNAYKVQILDPATGTGTFLSEIIDLIYSYFKKNKGEWNSYCKEHLIKRIFGFEYLMASYAMAHLKLDMKLKETGYIKDKDDNERFGIYLTNTLEEPPEKVQELFMSYWLTKEANDANKIKRDTPVMVVLGNPPYRGISENKGKWITDLIEEYKSIDGVHFGEKKHWLQDDYVKFIRYGQYLVDKNGEGILAYINNHSFIDNPTFRGMRWNLLKTFDKIYILDLHGNAKKKETATDGGKDENIFDIQQGVSINIFIKTNNENNNSFATVYHFDLFGERERKYKFLLEKSIDSIKWKKIKPVQPYFFFTHKNFSNNEEYEKGFSVEEIFTVNSVGIVTARDGFTIHETPQKVKNTIHEFLYLDDETARNRFNLGKDVQSWSVAGARNDLVQNPKANTEPDYNKIVKINYRPFDIRYTYYTGHSKGFHARPLRDVMQHFLKGENIGLIIGRQGQVVGSMLWSLIYITSNITDLNIYYRGGGKVYPLYLYLDEVLSEEKEERRPNLETEIVNTIAEKINLRFTKEKEEDSKTFAPIDILDYIYAILHSPKYREKYKEFLKIDFPRVPYPLNSKQFKKLVELGSRLRTIHLLESDELEKGNIDFPEKGNNEIDKINYENNKVWINQYQYFGTISQEVWDFYIGGYQPAQKWLKDRKGEMLNYEDTQHYKKIINALKLTIKIQKEVDKIIE